MEMIVDLGTLALIAGFCVYVGGLIGIAMGIHIGKKDKK